MRDIKRKFMISGIAAVLFLPSSPAQPDDAALTAKARAIHERVLKLDTHNDIDPSNFTADCNYKMRLTTQVNLPKMIEGGMDVSFMIVYVGQGPLTPAGFDDALESFQPGRPDRFATTLESAVEWMAGKENTPPAESAKERLSFTESES